MPAIQMVTLKDLIDYALDYLGGAASQEATRDVRRAVRGAFREFCGAHRFNYFMAKGRIVTSASYATGTVAYTHTGGAFERLVTLTSGVWPTWADKGRLNFNSAVYDVGTRESDTQITLLATTNPGANVAAGTSYTLFRDSYALPNDFLAGDQFINMSSAIPLTYVTPGDWLNYQRHTPPSVAAPRNYSIWGSPDQYSILNAVFYPPPDSAYNIDFVYQRRPRPLVVEEYKDGTVSITANTSTITGTSTAFKSGHVGSIIRIGSATDYPTGADGASPAQEERIITARASGTSLTVDEAITTAYSAVKYVISDPVDLEYETMLTALLRCIEKQSTLTRIMENDKEARAAYRDALILAREMDSRNFGPTDYGRRGVYLSLRDYPSGGQVG